MKTWSEEDIAESYEDAPENILCPYCENRGYRVLLGPKILGPKEPRPEDYDSFLECPTCYEVIPIHEGLKEETIKDEVETQESAFDNKFILETIPKRSSPRGKRISAKRSKKKIRLDDDPEIDALLRAYGDDRVRVIE
jgi:hypothetical protein